MVSALLVAIGSRLRLWWEALAALAALAGAALAAAFGRDGFAKPFFAHIASPDGQRQAFALLRAAQPNLVLSRTLVKSYPGQGTAIVARYADVKDVLARDQDFHVVYQPRMETVTGGENFFLGMQDTPRYTRDVSNMRLAFRRDDAALAIAPLFAARAAALTAAKPGGIDAPRELFLPAAAHFLDAYFGTPGPSEAELIDVASTLFWYLFIDLAGDAALEVRAVAAAAKLRGYLDAAIARRKAELAGADDILARCLRLQASGTPGMTDLDIRNNLAGLMIGAVPTTSKAACQALDQLLARPDALAGAQRAARADDDALLASYVFEALRFNPINPIIYRRAARDTYVGGRGLRRRKIAKDTMVLAANLSAMFDPLALDAPGQFRAGRPWSDYILWGDGQHTCFGAHINRVTIPALLKPLLQKQRLARANGAAGQIDSGGTPFPVHFSVVYDD